MTSTEKKKLNPLYKTKVIIQPHSNYEVTYGGIVYVSKKDIPFYRDTVHIMGINEVKYIQNNWNKYKFTLNKIPGEQTAYICEERM